MSHIFLQMPFRELDIMDYQKRVLFFDPSIVYDRIKVDCFKRIQDRVWVDSCFPVLESGLCGCGCGEKTLGRRKRWATEDCQRFTYEVTHIICNTYQAVTRYMGYYYPFQCIECGALNEGKQDRNGCRSSSIHVDHIVPVYRGGGGCWLNNYQLLCHTCHKKKTKEDFGYSEKVVKIQPPTLF